MKKLFAIALFGASTAFAVDNPFSSLTELTTGNLADGDLFAVTDISNTSQSVNGTTLKIKASSIGAYLYNDTAFAVGWDADTTHAPTKNAVYDYFHLISSTDNGKVTQLNTSAAGFVPTNASGVIGTARVITAGTATTVTNGDGSAANPTINFDPTGLTGNRTWANGSNASLTWTWDLSGTDPVLTVGSGVLNVTTGSLQVGGLDVATTSGSQVFTNKTFDASATGNVLKLKSLPQFTSPLLVDGAGCTIGTTSTTIGYGLANYLAANAQASNYAQWRFVVPADWDTSVDPTITLVDMIGADTAVRRYIVGVISVASSGQANTATGTPINVDMTADASGVSGDIEIKTATLNGWGAAVTPGRMMTITVARDGTSGTDTSSVNSTLIGFEISYGATQ
jgi:hypothetical protein